MKNVEDIYPATPMQELMLLHAIGQPDRDRLLSQFGFEIRGALDPAAVEAAWSAVVARHAVLRTAFVTKKVAAPLQVIRQTVSVPFANFDWREEDRRVERFESWCADDRREGVDTQRAPLMRFALFRFDDETWRLVWTSHHLLMDRWCLNELFADFDEAYRKAKVGEPVSLPTAPSFRQYVDWLGQQDVGTAENYWRKTLAGFHAPTPLASTRPDGHHVCAQHFTLGKTAAGDLHDAAKRFAVSPVALVQAALALVIAEHTARGDVIFGTAAAARPPGIANVERIVGSFVNNLPVRIRLERERTVSSWLRAIAQASFSRSEAEHLSPLAIAELAALADDAPLFDTLLVWLAPTDDALPLDMQPLWDDMATAYPLTLSVAEKNASLTLHVHQYADDPEHGAHILERMRATLATLCACTADDTLKALMADNTPDAEVAPDIAAIASSKANPVAAEADEHGGREKIPDTLLRQLVQHQFCRALGVDDAAPDDDFFALGGNSLRAAQLHTQLCQGTRKNVPLLALFANPTVDGITTTLTAQAWPERQDRLLPLRDSGVGTPLYCVASPEVNTLGYFMLSRHLPVTQSVFVLQAPPVTDTPQPMDPDIIEPLARDYVDAMRAHQPNGPYQLLGMCGGAHLSLAMTRLLEADGEEVSFIGIVNTWSLYSVSYVYYLHRFRRVLAYYRRRIRGMLGGADPEPAPAPTVPTEQDGPANEDVGLGNPWIRDVGFAHRWPDPAPLPGQVHVFRIKRQQYWRVDDEALGWGRFFTGGANIVHLPAQSHQDVMREPDIGDLAQSVAARLPGVATRPREDHSADTAGGAADRQVVAGPHY